MSARGRRERSSPGSSAKRGGRARVPPRTPSATTSPAVAPSGPWNLRDGIALALVLTGTLLLRASALRLPFFADDYLFLDQARGRSLWVTLTSGDPLGNFFRPVGRQFYFWTLAALSGESPVVFHAVNLAAFALAVALLFVLARRLAGVRAAVIASGVVALHYAADVPIRWASGSQDLLALLGALGTLLLYLSGRRAWAGLLLLAALLCKETVVLTPVIAVLADRRVRERWLAVVRRGWPLGLAIAVWAALWASTVGRLAHADATVALDPAGLPAAFVHLLQTAVGLEWSPGTPPRIGQWPPWVPLAAVLLALAWAWRSANPAGAARAPSPAMAPERAPGSAPGPRPQRAPVALGPVRLGLVWALLGALPVAAVAAIWSSYYYLFALCGLALALGAALSRLRLVGAIAVLALLAWGSQCGRGQGEFSVIRGPWSTMSHVNRFYIERSMRYVSRYLADLRRERPALPARSTVFFAGIPSSIAFQAGDGPLVRWAYRDSSLRSYYITRFTLDHTRRGPVFFFSVSKDTLREILRDPEELIALGIGMMLEEKLDAARDALEYARRQAPEPKLPTYALAWVQWARGERDTARVLLAATGAIPIPGPTPEIVGAMRAITRRDTIGAYDLMTEGVAKHALDPGAHALLADIALTQQTRLLVGSIESFAARVLAPSNASAWRRWGMVLAREGRWEGAVDALERYRDLGGPRARSDAEVQRWIASLRRMMPGGDLARKALRRLPDSP